jgi:hypothetical protein
MVQWFGIIRAFDKELYTASVEVEGYQASKLEGVPVAMHLREDLVIAGTRCVVLMNDGFDCSDAVVVVLFGGRPADDPAMDPVLGHRHRGFLRDGPAL